MVRHSLIQGVMRTDVQLHTLNIRVLFIAVHILYNTQFVAMYLCNSYS